MNRAAIATCLMLGVLMQALDTTIANVALPYMQGSLSASQDEIGWVLTSYIVAAAIMTPPTGFLASRLGAKRLYLICIGGFTIASMLCGAAQTLPQIVLFRVMQGMCGAALAPLAQSLLYNMAPEGRQGTGMSWFGIAVMVGPVLGPVVVGYLTEYLNWRYVFYVNLPLGIITFVGTLIFMPEFEGDKNQKLDWFGFGMLGIGVGALQIMLDRGEEKDWFSSSEIIIETVIAACAFYLFIVQTFCAREPFIKPALFRDRNFTAGVIFIAIVGMTYFSSMALLPPYLQGLMNYPVLTAGLVMGPRGIGTMVAMLVVGRLVAWTDYRALLALGIALTAFAFYRMMHWTPDVPWADVVITGTIQGIGLGFLFVPLSIATIGTLTPQNRALGAGIYNLSRNIGSSVGISIVNSLLTRNTQVLHATINGAITPFDRNLMAAKAVHFWNPATQAGAMALNNAVDLQASIIAYDDNYKLAMFAILASIPLLVMFKRITPPSPKQQSARKPGELVHME